MTSAWRYRRRGGNPLEPFAPGRLQRRDSRHRRRHGDPAAMAPAPTAGPGRTTSTSNAAGARECPAPPNGPSPPGRRAAPQAAVGSAPRSRAPRKRLHATTGGMIVGSRLRRGPCLVTRHRRWRATWVRCTAVRWVRGSYAPPPLPAAPAAPPPVEQSSGSCSCGECNTAPSDQL